MLLKKYVVKIKLKENMICHCRGKVLVGVKKIGEKFWLGTKKPGENLWGKILVN